MDASASSWIWKISSNAIEVAISAMSKTDFQPPYPSTTLPRLTAAEFEQISQFAHDRFGLDLRTGKEELVAARLSKKIRQGGFTSFGQYLKAAASDSTGHELSALVHALTTHHTSFYREAQHFSLLESLIRGEFAQIPSLRIWSAACSTGEEPFTIAGCVAALRANRLSWEMLATDISAAVLETAQNGIYTEEAVAPLPLAWQKACFQKGHGKWAGKVRVRPEIMERIRFAKFNLVDSDMVESKWHLIFCRNVMIYFDRQTQDRVVRRLALSLEPGGYLMVGHSESLASVTHGLEYVCPATYRKPGGGYLRGGRR